MRNINPPLALIFLGLQGSGKGTQAFQLMKKYPASYIETGGIFRKMEKTRKGPLEALKFMEKGKLVPIKVTNLVMRREIKKVPRNRSLIIDGYPRTLGQVYGLNKALGETGRDKNYEVVFFRISKKEALKRLLNRWLCSKCGMIFNSYKAKCKCGGRLEKRSDENLGLIKNRFKYVSKDLEKVKKYFQKKGKLIKIDAERPIEVITLDLIRRLEI